MDESREKLLDEMEKQFALSGYRDYIDSHFKEAFEVFQNGGSIYDLDGIVHLKELLGRDISYELYEYIDSEAFYEDTSILDLSEKDVESLAELCDEFAAQKAIGKQRRRDGPPEENLQRNISNAQTINDVPPGSASRLSGGDAVKEEVKQHKKPRKGR